ncbi:MAG: hypothetical protein IJS08_01010 [Victivallales bacterium]|nr:hypothetical protein [Victivallales bacterium]
MIKKLIVFLASSLLAMGYQLSDKTLTRLGKMPVPPAIDGRIALGEWDCASTTFGGINPQNGLMTYRESNFRLGYDKDFIYFACTSELPIPPQQLEENDTVELILLPPGADKPHGIKANSQGKGILPEGTRIANDFYADTLTSYLRKCWTVEMAIPIKAFGIESIEDGKPWGLQMKRNWTSMPETGCWHHTSSNDELGTFIPDSTAPAISFDGFGHSVYRDSSNYVWTHRIENTTGSPIEIKSSSEVHAFNNPPTLDMINLETLGEARRVPLEPRQQTIQAGKTGYVELYLMAQFVGTRQIYSHFQDARRGTLFYRRRMYWDVAKSKKTTFKDEKGLPYVCSAFYPSYGNKLKVACVFSKTLPCMKAVVEVKDANGKVLKSYSRSNGDRPVADFEEETTLPNLPLGKYFVTMTATDAQGRQYTQTRTFENAKFPWQGNKIGCDRIIIPPFKPLEVKEESHEVHALMTGYRIGGELWDRIYAQEFPTSQRENILAAPIRFLLNGRPFGNASCKLISKEEDKVVYETQASTDEAAMTITQEYDFDGFCKADIKIVPKGTLQVNDFRLEIPLRNDIVKYYSSTGHAGARSGNAPDLSIPAGEGELDLKGIKFVKGAPAMYFWLGGIYKGFCIINDLPQHFNLQEDQGNVSVTRNGDTVTFNYIIVNKGTLWQEPLSYTFGFEPTPVKPQAEGLRAIGEYMYDYPQPKGAIWATMRVHGSIVNNMVFPPGQLINNDDSYLDFVFAHRGKPVSDKERLAFVDDFMARNGEWIRKNMPTVSLAPLLNTLKNKRHLGVDKFIMYNDPLLYSCLWPEAEMYKAEWLPWDYPADDAINEYACTHNKSYMDKLLWYMRERARRGFDGMNFDCFPLGGGYNTTVNGGYRFRPGKVPNLHNGNMLQTASAGIKPANSLFKWRELTRRTAIMMFQEGKTFMGYPWVELHTTNSQCVPVTAFCSTTITWERSSRGDEYQLRFPEGFIMAESAGTQSGTVPRCIVSTKPMPGHDPHDIAESLVAHSFAYGLLQHVDQGIIKNDKNYALWRDIVFDFGYARPENKTLFFYSQEKQPVTCSQPGIKTSQVIRPDGKTLVLIGSSLDKPVRAIFDVSGLKYGKCRFTDIRSGTVIDKPELDIPKFSYGMLLIERLAP